MNGEDKNGMILVTYVCVVAVVAAIVLVCLISGVVKYG